MSANPVLYRATATDYFAPSQFLRADVGLGYSLPFSTPRFQGDRQSGLTASYLLGTDNRGTVYHRPSLGVGFEFASGITIDLRANSIRSRTYNETSCVVGLRVTPH